MDSVTDNYYQDSQSSAKIILANKPVSHWKSDWILYKLHWIKRMIFQEN